MGYYLLFAAMLLFVPALAHAHGYDGAVSLWGHAMGCGYGGLIMWILTLILVGVVIYIVLQSSRVKGGLFGDERETPLDILKKRYARGEITKEEFDRVKRELGL